MEPLNDLQELLPESKEVVAGGETFAIRPFGFRVMLKAVPRFASLTAFVKVKDGHLDVDIHAILTHLPEEICALCSMATGKPLDWFDRLDFEEGVALAAAVLTVNADFFARVASRKLHEAAQGSHLPGADGPT